jgi:beta-glucosidase-like glycosyl hydrolase
MVSLKQSPATADLLKLCTSQQKQIDELTERVASLELQAKSIAEMETLMDALKAKMKEKKKLAATKKKHQRQHQQTPKTTIAKESSIQGMQLTFPKTKLSQAKRSGRLSVKSVSLLQATRPKIQQAPGTCMSSRPETIEQVSYAAYNENQEENTVGLSNRGRDEAIATAIPIADLLGFNSS